MTQNTNPATTDDVFAEIGQNGAARRIVNRIFADAASRARRTRGRSYTTAREIDRVAARDAKVNAAIIAFVRVVRSRTATDARVERACDTLRRRTGLMNANTAPIDLASAIREM